MFVKKFPQNHLIKKIKISGPFISVYVPEAELENFQKKYEKLFNQYSILSIGEGVMHDFAHHTHNKHISSLFKNKSDNEKKEHFHFILPAIVNESSLNVFLDALDDQDLSQDEKQQFLKEFKDQSHAPTLDNLLEQINSSIYVVSGLLYSDPYLAKMMPLLTELARGLDPYTNNDGSVNIPPSTMIKVGTNYIDAQGAYNNFIALLTHINALASVKDILDKVQKGEKEATPETIKELNALFKTAAIIPLPNFATTSHLFKELATHLPIIDGDFNKAYAMLKEHLISLLKTEELIFTPQVINLPPEELAYQQAILFLSKQGTVGQKIMDTMFRLHEGKESFWNPYWINSGTKLKGIVDAVLKLQEEGEDKLKMMIQNPESELYLALNKQRLFPLTFLGACEINKSKSIIKVEEETSNLLKL